ncbi:MAG TPA: hypothetical protein VK213_03785 [Bacteroidales bacterium]|nr:hypothetical protein [Bacteroidales bacterium]
MIRVIGIKIIDRIKEAGLTQEILSRHASVITTRLGFHEVTDSVCSREAYIILHLKDDDSGSRRLADDLRKLGGIELREIEFDSAGDNSRADEKATLEILCILTERDPEIILKVQKILTSFGCNIRTRLGVNETFFGSPAGLIILELSGERHQRQLLENDLRALDKIHVRSMTF